MIHVSKHRRSLLGESLSTFYMRLSSITVFCIMLQLQKNDHQCEHASND